MASHRRPKQPSRARVTVLTTAAAAAVVLGGNSAQAAPAKPSKGEVKEKVDKLHEEAEQATEKYNGAKEKQKKLEKEIDALQDNVARGQEDLNELRDAIGMAAAAQYRSGTIDSSMQLFLSADPDDYLDKASTLDQLSNQQVEALAEIQDKQRELAQQRQEATTKMEDLSDTTEELGKRQQEVKGKLAEAQKLLNSLTAAERAEMAQDEAKSALQSASLAGGGGAAASGRAADAFAAAQSKIGTPYSYGATGPGSFDCSGLTSWAYGQAGVGLPRTSQQQANYGTRIGMSELKVGDLVIFYSDLHHVGLYAGNGQVLHAPRTGTFVRYESINNMPFQFGVRV
ncbi:NlpC/P60 family protein [Streptomyces sp. UH6]|uniref:C40 family peptidase n=1 Tax=Streptomyces sp. UH6 TaxID=2748379 RepID=UPI0015D4C399|nr:C40 family peptidase [Streptomyces sp. UH6]NYV77848.1 C40 family peptidase [Streptomyces sp. UH6]